MTEQFKQFHDIINSGINNDSRTIIAVDNFYTDPDAVRDFSINNFNFEASQWHKGQRSHEKLIVDGTKEKFENILGRKVSNWDYNYNGVFLELDQVEIYFSGLGCDVGVAFLLFNTQNIELSFKCNE